jgi:hypothetical protein
VALALGVELTPALAAADTSFEQEARNLSSVIAKPAPRNAAGPACTQNVTITSIANNNFVSTELGYAGNNYAMLRARATAEGPWEKYNVCYHPSSRFNQGYWTIQSQANGLYVSAELGYAANEYAMLRARASIVGPWERYNVVSCGFGCSAIQSQANGLFVSAELGYSGDQHGMLRARAFGIGPWEQFR